MNLEQILQSLHADELRSAAAPEAPSQCPSLPRFREGLLNARRWTEEERHHLHEDGCGDCKKVSDAMRKEIWHPGLLDLFKHVFHLQPADARFVKLHLERDDCERCGNLAAWMGRVSALQKMASADLARVQDFLNLVASSLVPMPVPARAAVQAWDSADAEAFFREIPLGEGSLVTLQEEGKCLQLTLSSRVAQLAGQELVLALQADHRPVLEVPLVLEPDVEGWFTASADLGPLPEALERLGEGELWPVLYPRR